MSAPDDFVTSGELDRHLESLNSRYEGVREHHKAMLRAYIQELISERKELAPLGDKRVVANRVVANRAAALAEIKVTHPRWYDQSSVGHEEHGRVAELHLGNHAVAQVGALPDDDGFLIRVWPQNGTHEYGGVNITAFNMVIRTTDGPMRVEDLDFRGDSFTLARAREQSEPED